MPVLNLTVADLAGLFLRLLPRGRVWPKMLDAIQARSIAAIMPTYERLIARDNNLLIDAFPATSVETAAGVGSHASVCPTRAPARTRRSSSASATSSPG